MKKIRTLTFHSSYNYGSNLQAYALQKFVQSLFPGQVNYKIINFQTNNQKKMYRVYEYLSLKNLIKRIIFIKYKKELIERDNKFYNFINNKLNLTKEIINVSDFHNLEKDIDYIIFGSDQIWNYNAHDFEWIYYGDFETTAQKISYATSMGPKTNVLNDKYKNKIIKNLHKFKDISVRDEETQKFLKQNLNINSQIHVDPTFLIKKDEWEKEISTKRIISGKYILLYDLYGDKDSLEIGKKIQKKMKIPIYVIKNHYLEYFFYNFKKYYECGPLEFLNIIKNAELVITSSFHGTVFSIIFNKLFFAVNGMKDIRISNILKKYDLEDRSISLENIELKFKDVYNINFKKANLVINEDIKKATKYLKKNLD